MAEGAPDAAEQRLAIQLRRCGGGWSGGSGEPHEAGEVGDVGDRGASARADGGSVFRCRIEDAAGHGRPLIWEYFVRHARLNVVGLARENLERLVLGLPAESRHGAVVAVGVQPSPDAKRCFLRGIGGEVCLKCGVRSVLYQAKAKYWGRDTKTHVGVGELEGEVRLRQVAARSIAPA